MAKMTGKRLTLLQPKFATVRLNLEQIQHIVDGLVENRKNIKEEHLDLYDSMAMDFLEELEKFGVYFPELVLGQDENASDAEQAARILKEIMSQTFQIEKILGTISDYDIVDEQDSQIADVTAKIRENAQALRKLLFGETDVLP